MLFKSLVDACDIFISCNFDCAGELTPRGFAVKKKTIQIKCHLIIRQSLIKSERKCVIMFLER